MPKNPISDCINRITKCRAQLAAFSEDISRMALK